MNKLDIGKLAALMFLTVVGSQQGALADRASDLFKTDIPDIYAGLPPSSPASPSSVRVNIDRQREDLGNAIVRFERSGGLTKEQVDDIRARLNYVDTQRSQFMSDGVITNSEAGNLYGVLARAGRQIEYYQIVRESAAAQAQANELFKTDIPDIYAGLPPSSPASPSSVRTNIDRQREYLGNQLARMYRGGFTKEQAEGIKARVDYIDSQRAQFMTDGVITNSEAGSLYGEISRAIRQFEYFRITQGGAASAAAPPTTVPVSPAIPASPAFPATSAITASSMLNTPVNDRFAGLPPTQPVKMSSFKSNIENPRMELGRELSRLGRSGSITTAQVDDIRARLKNIDSLYGQYTADHIITNSEASSLYGEVARADKQLEYYRRTNASSNWKGSNSWNHDSENDPRGSHNHNNRWR